MAKSPTKTRTRIPEDPQRLAEWLAPRPDESYEQWSQRFDRAERRLERRRTAPTAPRNRQRQRGSQPGRRAA